MRPVRDGQPLAPAPLRMPVALREFLREETAGGAVLMTVVVVALAWANSPWQGAYDALWRTALDVRLGRFELTGDLRQWVNEGLMALFFLVVGLEIKRELVEGELRSWRRAALPLIAAAGGMLLPAAIYAALNARGPGAAGWGVPMATDIAFALGVLALLGPRVPAALKLFLLALAIVDDLGSILVVALFYSGELRPPALALAAVLVLAILGLRRARIYWTPLYVAAGIGLWLALHAAGVNAALAGVATVAGIGFTVPLFVAGLAFPGGAFEAAVKLGLLLASVVAGLAGVMVLRGARPAEPPS